MSSIRPVKDMNKYSIRLKYKNSRINSSTSSKTSKKTIIIRQSKEITKFLFHFQLFFFLSPRLLTRSLALRSPAHVPGILIARRFPRIPRYPAPVKRPLKVYLAFKFLLIPQLQPARLSPISAPITPSKFPLRGGREKREGRVGETTVRGSPP